MGVVEVPGEEAGRNERKLLIIINYSHLFLMFWHSLLTQSDQRKLYPFFIIIAVMLCTYALRSHIFGKHC